MGIRGTSSTAAATSATGLSLPACCALRIRRVLVDVADCAGGRRHQWQRPRRAAVRARPRAWSRVRGHARWQGVGSRMSGHDGLWRCVFLPLSSPSLCCAPSCWGCGLGGRRWAGNGSGALALACNGSKRRMRYPLADAIMDAAPFLAEISRRLDAVGLEAILIGNAAAALHGAPVTTIDFDFLFRKTPRNLQKLKAFARALDATILRPYIPCRTSSASCATMGCRWISWERSMACARSRGCGSARR